MLYQLLFRWKVSHRMEKMSSFPSDFSKDDCDNGDSSDHASHMPKQKEHLNNRRWKQAAATRTRSGYRMALESHQVKLQSV